MWWNQNLDQVLKLYISHEKLKSQAEAMKVFDGFKIDVAKLEKTIQDDTCDYSCQDDSCMYL